MRKRHPNPRLVKIHQSYTVEEAARLLSVHRHTVRRWLKEGLHCLTEQKPFLILGRHLFAFLTAKRAKHKQKCRPGEIYCVRCRAPKAPAGGMVEFKPSIGPLGNLAGICPDCNSMMYRRASEAKLAIVCGSLEITISEAEPHISETTNPSENVDFEH